MFGLFKPGYEQLLDHLPATLRGTYKRVFEAIEDLIPSYWHRRTRERTLNLVMADWLLEVADERLLPVPPRCKTHAAKVAEVTRRFNDRDPRDGWQSSSRANEILAALREDGLIPPPDER
jgi:hypothetical protein